MSAAPGEPPMSERAAQFERAFVTPEGVDLRLSLGRAGDRAIAFLIDIIIILMMIVGLIILCYILLRTFGGSSIEIIGIVWLLGFFVLRNGYFLAFELGGRAATPGKRAMGLRVVARDGGRLTGEAVIARNALRELEVVLPLAFLGELMGAAETGDWTWLAVLAWVVVFLFFPLFNRDRLRVGDLIAGTWVVRTPRRKLGVRISEERDEGGYVFTDAQLDAYGEFELKALEDVLRRQDELAVIVVARTIRGRIGWTGGEGDDLGFLRAYYAALCRKLERGMLFGKRRADKHARG
jgi:uncharacterized RDD family membrane protein YckC